VFLVNIYYYDYLIQVLFLSVCIIVIPILQMVEKHPEMKQCSSCPAYWSWCGGVTCIKCFLLFCC